METGLRKKHKWDVGEMVLGVSKQHFNTVCDIQRRGEERSGGELECLATSLRFYAPKYNQLQRRDCETNAI